MISLSISKKLISFNPEWLPKPEPHLFIDICKYMYHDEKNTLIVLHSYMSNPFLWSNEFEKAIVLIQSIVEMMVFLKNEDERQFQYSSQNLEYRQRNCDLEYMISILDHLIIRLENFQYDIDEDLYND